MFIYTLIIFIIVTGWELSRFFRLLGQRLLVIPLDYLLMLPIFGRILGLW